MRPLRFDVLNKKTQLRDLLRDCGAAIRWHVLAQIWNDPALIWMEVDGVDVMGPAKTRRRPAFSGRVDVDLDWRAVA